MLRRTLVAAAVVLSIWATDATVHSQPIADGASHPRSGHTGKDLPGGSGVEQNLPPAGKWHVYLPMTYRLSGVAPVVASVGRGFYDAQQTVTLATSTAGAEIRYTTDGSLPTDRHGHRYVAPITIDRTTTLRAVAYSLGFPTSPVSTYTYLFLDDVIRLNEKDALSRGYPKEWGKYPPDGRLAGQDVEAAYGMDPNLVGTYEETIRDDLRALPSLSIVTSVEDMFGREGLYSNPLDEGRERAVSVELIHPDGQPGFQVDCGARIAGGWSRKADVTRKFSFSLRFRSRYGVKRLRFPLFADSPVASFDTLRLRASQADSFYYFADKGQYLHDQWGRDTQRDMGALAAHGRYVHAYINGMYWGLYNLAEEPTAAFASDHEGGDEADWDVMKDGELVDGVWQPEVEDGDDAAFNQILEVIRQSPDPDPNNADDRLRYEQMARLVDLSQHADYTLLQIYGANTDWPNKNWRMARNRALDEGFDTLIWDYEHLTALHDDPSRGFCVRDDRDPNTNECGFIADTDGVLGLHGWLLHFPEYRVLFADRANQHLFGEGPLTPIEAAARYRARAQEIDRAIVGESARWGTGPGHSRSRHEQFRMWSDYWSRHGKVPQTHAMWVEERNRLLSEYFPTRTRTVIDQLCRQGLFPHAPAPQITVTERALEKLTTVSMSLGGEGCSDSIRDGTIYFTVDGSDPREPWTGGVSTGARAYVKPVLLLNYARVRARTYTTTERGPEWSAVTEATFGVPRIAITEVMYHPADGSDYEFVEIKNLESDAIDISGATISDAITFTMPAGTLVEPGGYVVVAADPPAFRSRYGDVALAGAYDGKLDNAGERLIVRLADGEPLAELTYDDNGFWPVGPDRLGHSLVPVSGATDPTHPESWRASAWQGGSPGAADPEPRYGPGRVFINEILAFPDEVQEDAIEIHNPSTHPVDISGWELADNKDGRDSFVIPQGALLRPGDFVVFYRSEFDSGSGGFGLGSKGESVYLRSLDSMGLPTGYMRGATYGAGARGTSFGRVETPAGLEFVALAAPTFGVAEPDSVEDFRSGNGAPNESPRVGPVVINEVMYAPASDGYEYVELFNRTDDWVPLFDEDEPARRWALTRGVKFTFPATTWIAPRGHLIVSGTDERAFRDRYVVPYEIPVHGPFDGRLDNAGESVELARPWPSEDSDGVWIVEDRLTYGNGEPWPPAAAGEGPSLERTHAETYGNDPRNWTALSVGGTPGRTNSVPSVLYVPWAMRWY